MYRILNNLYVGKASMVSIAQEAGYSVLGACKYPLHQQNARLAGNDKPGYLKIPHDEPEYLYAYREHALYLNLVDGEDYCCISDDMIDVAILFIQKEIDAGFNVFICCNQAESRSPSIAFIYMIHNELFAECKYFENAYMKFKSIYPFYNPRKGMFDYTKNYFEKWRAKNG